MAQNVIWFNGKYRHYLIFIIPEISGEKMHEEGGGNGETGHIRKRHPTFLAGFVDPPKAQKIKIGGLSFSAGGAGVCGQNCRWGSWGLGLPRTDLGLCVKDLLLHERFAKISGKIG